MKINFFAVNNFRGISGGLDQNKITFSETNTIFIYGQNNVGKSTFLKAYEFFYADSVPSIDDYFNKDTANNIELEIEFSLDELDLSRIEKAAPQNKKESYKEYINDNRLRFKKIWQKKGKTSEAINLTYRFDKNEYVSSGYASIGIHNVFKSCMPRPIFIKAMPTEIEAKSILNEILKAMAESTLQQDELIALNEAREKIKELQEKMYNPETICKYEDSVNTYLNKVFNDTKIIFKDQKDRVAWTENKIGKEYDIEFKKIDADGNLDENIPSSVDKIGHGTIRTAIFTLLLMRDVAEKFERQKGRKDYMVLFEEPELFLYPKIERELRELIYQVSEDDLPYQVLCASHSASMIDLSKPKSSTVRLISTSKGTEAHQINTQFLKNAKNIKTDAELKQEMYEILRFNPYICESFYADEVILIEGPTEELIIRAFFQHKKPDRDIFILNCGTVNNIPFYQKVFSQFRIKYHVICDTDSSSIESIDEFNNPTFETGIQGSISKQFIKDKSIYGGNQGLFRVHSTTFEPAHRAPNIPQELHMPKESGNGKPFDANEYWKNILYPNINHENIDTVPIIKYLKEIIS